MKRITALLILMFCFSVQAKETIDPLKQYKPSFDCRKAENYAELAICSNTYLGQLDGLLQKIYESRLDPQFGTDKKLMKKQQIEWLKKRNDCTSENCIRKIYKEKINALCEIPVVYGAYPKGSYCSVLDGETDASS